MQMQAKILVVDDELELLELYRELLVPLGAEIMTLSSAKAALQLLDKEDFDCVLSDLKMPEMDGLNFCAGARAKRPDIPFVFLTAHGDWKAGLQALRLGANDFLEKPIQSDELLKVMSFSCEVGLLRRKIRLELQNMADQKNASAMHVQQILKDLSQIAWARNLQSLG